MQARLNFLAFSSKYERSSSDNENAESKFIPSNNLSRPFIIDWYLKVRVSTDSTYKLSSKLNTFSICESLSIESTTDIVLA